MASVTGPSLAPDVPSSVHKVPHITRPVSLTEPVSGTEPLTTPSHGHTVDHEYPVTANQYEILRMDHAHWCQLDLALLKPYYGNTYDWIYSSFNVLVQRHACLRSTFSAADWDGKILNQVMKVTAPLSESAPMYGSKGPPLSHDKDDAVASITIEERDEGIAVILHIRRALIDSMSFGALQVDFALLLCGLPARDCTPMLAYVDHVAAKTIDQTMDFWHKKFEGATITRPTVYQSAPISGATKDRDTVSLQLGRHTLQHLAILSANGDFSRKTFFESLWAVVLHSHGSSNDIVFAVSERDRSFGGRGTCVGNLDQVYPIRIIVDDEQLLSDVAKSVEFFHTEASPFGYPGFDSIRKRSGLQSSAGSMLRYSDTVCPQAFEVLAFDLPLIVHVADRGAVTITLSYNAELERCEVQLLLQHYVNALENTLEKNILQPSRVADIELTSETERKSLIERATSPKALPATEVTDICTLFEAQVRATPTKPAVQFEQDKCLSFDEFNKLSNRIARALRLRPRTFVPVCMDRSVIFLACLFAIIKSGAAYVVVDPAGASQRNSAIVDNCSAEVVLTSREYASAFNRACVIDDLACIGDTDSTSFHAANLGLEIDPKDPCYVVYTSGSTGTPKGVVLTHRAATSGITHFSLNGRARWLLFYNPIFSAAQRTMIATLVKGGCLLLASKNTLSTSLEQTINEMHVDALGITPSALALLDPSSVPTLEQVTLVGELVNQDVLNKWYDQVELRNSFGLSECTQLNFGTRLKSGSNCRIVGRPNDTTSAFVLKQGGSLELAPTAVVGELCLAGPQLATGYLHNPEQTANVFVDNPFGPGKLYRTGDAVRQHHNGDIEVVGRLDFQIKINGQRTEPSEIDEALLKHPAIHSCATAAAQLGEHKTLVCALVRSEKQMGLKALVTELRAFLDARLPSYMIPSYWLPVKDLPINANGKTDISAIRLQAQRLGHRGLLDLLCEGEVADVRPFENQEEVAIRDAWAQILHLSLDSIHHSDSFVTLGGGSIQAITVVAELRKHGLKVELAMILSSSTLEEIANTCVLIEPVTDEDPEPFSLLQEGKKRDDLKRDGNTSDAYPVTPLQESLLAATLGGSSAYLYQRVWDLAGVDISRLRDATQTVFEHSDILRTTFVPHGKSFIQMVKADVQLPWSAAASDLAEYKQHDKEAGIAIGQPLFRMAVIQDKYLVVTMHHSLFDFWSHRFLYQDIATIYYHHDLLQRPRFSRFVRHILDMDVSQAEKFWAGYLANANKTTLNYAPTDEHITARRDLAVGLGDKAKKMGVTMGTLIYTSWAIVLARQINAADVCFAATVSGREVPIPAIDRLDGPTLTTVLQRVSVDNEMTAMQLTKRVSVGFFDVIEFSQLGMRKSIQTAKLSTDVCDTLVNVLAKNDDDELSQNLFKRHGPKPIWNSEYTTLEAEELEDAFQLRISANMEARRAEFLLESTALVMETIVADPGKLVGQIEIIGAKERNFLLQKERIEEVLESSSLLLHDRFENTALSSPDREAIDWDSSRSVTYKELNDEANKLAAYLRGAHGLGRGDTIPLLLDKSVETIVAILGVMKAGAAYVPLSPDNPVDRNVFIIQDVGGQVILTQDSYLDFAGDIKAQSVSVSSVLASEDTFSPVSIDQSPEDIAYVIYTSGSTGNPKGVKVSHRASASAVTSMLQAEGRDRDEWRTLQFANYIFDASVQDIFNTLSSGGTLCMAPTEKLLSELPNAINEMRVKQAIITPTVAKLIEPEKVSGLEHLIVGGEPLTSDIVEKWAPLHKVQNVYGPTETSMVVTTKNVQPDDNPHNVGKPLGTVVAFIMNRDCTDLMPYGAVGELCVAGPQLADGYVNNDEATNDAFTACERLGIERMYKTGDLARWYPNGDIECLGRADNQVKVHGHRIELGEVEQAIINTDVVQDTAVVASSINDKPQLTAFAVFDANKDEQIEQPAARQKEVGKVKEGLNDLASYMIPKSVLGVGKLPTLPSGKVDRKKLTKWVEEMTTAQLSDYSIDAPGPQADIVPPATAAEAALQKFWADIFEREPTSVGATANFFSLGGDSVSAINLVSACRAAGYSLSVGNVLKYPVLRELASQLGKVDASADVQRAKNFEMSERVRKQIESEGLEVNEHIDYVYPAAPGQVEFLNQGQRKDRYWVLMAIRPLPESANINAWIKAATELTRLNAILRTFFVQSNAASEERGKDPQWAGVVLKSPEINISSHDCPTAEERESVIENIWRTPFPAGKPWIQYAVLNLADGKREVLVRLDHALYDGTLFRLFDEQFVAIQHGNKLPEREDFKCFAMHMWRTDKKEALDFWADYMAGNKFDYPSLPSASTSSSATSPSDTSNVDEAETAVKVTKTRNPKITALVTLPTNISLDPLVTKHNITPSIVFQTAFQLYLMRETGARDISFDYLLSGRNIDLPNPQLISGNLANILPFRSKLSTKGEAANSAADKSTTTLVSYLEETQSLFWQITDHGTLSLDDIFAAAKLDRATSSNRTLFLFQPFDPAAKKPDEETMEFIVLKGAQVRMFQPYALVVEISRTVEGHLVKVMYDEGCYSGEQARDIAREVVGIVERMVERLGGEGGDVGAEGFLEGL